MFNSNIFETKHTNMLGKQNQISPSFSIWLVLYLGEFVGLVDTCFPPLGLSFTKFRQEANLDSKAYNTQEIFFSSQVQEQIIIFYFLKTRCMFHICIVLGKVFRSWSLHKEHDRLTISSLLNGYAKTNIHMYKYIFL